MKKQEEKKITQQEMSLQKMFQNLDPQNKKQIKKHYSELDSVDKTIVNKAGFFLNPLKIKGKAKINVRKFLIIYFDSEDDYNFVKKILETGKGKSHPVLDTNKLLRILKEAE